jgi:hypothetical protein
MKHGGYKKHVGNPFNTGGGKAPKHSPVMKGGKSSMRACRPPKAC